jgi:ubiquinone/menaquinone biosynthesis C-methylase UbiE
LSKQTVGAPEDAFARVPDDWYVGFHTGLAASFWRAVGATTADRDAQLVRELLGPEVRTVLDVPCGDGRLTIRLAAAGLTATGVDIASAEVEHARRAAERESAQTRFLVGDLRALPDVGPVDAVVSWGNSFGYLTPAETARSLGEMHRVLRPGGRLVLESMSVAESMLVGDLSATAEYEFGGIRMTMANRYRPAESRMESDLVFEDSDGHVERGRVAHHVHTTGEVVRLLEAAGFREVVLLDGDGTSPYELGSSKLIVVAER